MANRGKPWIGRMPDRSLRIQLRIFLLIFVIMDVWIVTHLVRDNLNPAWALVGFIPGLVIGFFLARTKVLRWETTEKEVVASTDVVGALILVAYVVFLFFRSRIIGVEIENAALVSLIGLAITAGAMFSPVYFTVRGIRNILRLAGPAAGGHPT